LRNSSNKQKYKLTNLLTRMKT